MFDFFLLMCFAYIIYHCITDILEGIKADLREMFSSDDDFRTYP